MEKFLTRPEAADVLAVPARTLAAWAYTGKGPAYVRVGKHVRYRLSDLEAWTQRQRRDPEKATA